MTRRALVLMCCVLLVGCVQQKPVSEAPPATAPEATPSFVNRVWEVVPPSGIAPGALYTFLSDSTLLIASDHGTPSLGRWAARDGGLTMIEEGIAYAVTITTLTADTFAIVSESPAGTLGITFVPARPR